MSSLAMSPFARRSVAVAVGWGIDRCLGEPPDRWHPLVHGGDLLEALEARTYADHRWAGVGHVGAAALGAAAVGAVLSRTVGWATATAVTVGLVSAGAMLGETARSVAAALEVADLDEARARVRSLVGRDPTRLGESELSRAVIESLAENTVDAVTSTLFWAQLGGAPAALAHRAVNTLDAMVGHRNDRYLSFGWATARLDDALNFIPARLTVAVVALVRPRRAADVWRIVRRDGSDHPSPNGGRVEAAFAAALGIGLGGANDYGGVVEVRGRLGDGGSPDRHDIAPAIRLARDVSACAAIIPAAAALMLGFRQNRRRAVGKR